MPGAAYSATRMNEHIVHVHRDREFLVDSVSTYLQGALDAGEAAIVIARPALREALALRLKHGEGLHVLDAERTLERFMRDGMPQWNEFHRVVGGLIARLRLSYPGVRAYGEMVDILWQRGGHDAAIRLEEFWNELGRLQTFSLFCAYDLDSLDESAAGGGLERICQVHTQLIPARDHSLVDGAVTQASEDVLEPALSKILLTLAARQHGGAKMPLGQSTLLWLKRNMPHTAEQVLERARAHIAAEAA
jgi:hypothetical protein